MKIKQFINDGHITVFSDHLTSPIYKIHKCGNGVIVTDNLSITESSLHYDIETALRYITKDIYRREKIGSIQLY